MKLHPRWQLAAALGCGVLTPATTSTVGLGTTAGTGAPS
ncbi:MAG: hypothetical protein JWP22_1318 [Ramlibacter sp.]|nr:hypothetical protein [Ramlibacter sp.]